MCFDECSFIVDHDFVSGWGCQRSKSVSVSNSVFPAIDQTIWQTHRRAYAHNYKTKHPRTRRLNKWAKLESLWGSRVSSSQQQPAAASQQPASSNQPAASSLHHACSNKNSRTEGARNS
jgi:hypothetical protein